MSNPQDNRWRAFPTQGYDSPNHGWIYGSDGMYLRDYFAAAALQGALASDNTWYADDVADYAYKCADAMLAARKGEA